VNGNPFYHIFGKVFPLYRGKSKYHPFGKPFYQWAQNPRSTNGATQCKNFVETVDFITDTFKL